MTTWANLQSRGEALICHSFHVPRNRMAFACLVRWQIAAGCAFEGAKQKGCQDDTSVCPAPFGISSLVLHSHFFLPFPLPFPLPRAAATETSLRSLALRRASDANLCMPSIQQLNCDNAGTSVWLQFTTRVGYRRHQTQVSECSKFGFPSGGPRELWRGQGLFVVDPSLAPSYFGAALCLILCGRHVMGLFLR